MSNHVMGTPDLLRAAARLVDRARADLDTSGERCTCCGLFVKENMTHYTIDTQCASAATKLRRFADELDRKPTNIDAEQHNADWPKRRHKEQR